MIIRRSAWIKTDIPLKNKKTTPLPALDHVASRGQSNHLLRMLSQQRNLLEQVQSLLPEPVRDHCLHARIKGTQLVLHTDSSAWMTRLRFHGPQLVKALRSLAPGLQSVKIRVLIDSQARGPGRRAKNLSPRAAKSIQLAARSVADDKLSAALLRLGHLGDKNQEEA